MDTDFMENLGNIVKRTRKNLGMTQTDLGNKIDRPQSSIARLESGQLGDTHFGFILVLADALDMKVEDLVAKAFGREASSSKKRKQEPSEALQEIKKQIVDADPLARKQMIQMFDTFSQWIREVPEVPEHKK